MSGPCTVSLLALLWVLLCAFPAEGQAGSRHRRTSPRDTTGYQPPGAVWSRAGVTVEPFYTGAIISNLIGGVQRGRSLHGVADLVLTADPIPLVGWPGVRFGLSVVGTHGDDPGALVGDYQGVSDIAAPAALRLYELWLQKRLFDDRLSLLAGIYDVNAAFDVLETAGLFFNGSVGMGPGFACGGPVGAPTYPCPGLSLLARVGLGEEMELLGMAADGVPGDPHDPERPLYRLGGDEGFLLGSELAWVRGGDVLGVVPSAAPRARAHRRRSGPHRLRRAGGGGQGVRVRERGAERGTLQYSKIALGLWRNTSRFPILPAGGGDPLTREGSWGGYLLAERTLGVSRSDPRRANSFHLRVGMADRETEEVDRYASLGTVASRPMRDTGAQQFGAAVTAARLSRTGAEVLGVSGEGDRWEVAFEMTWRVEPIRGLALQPDIQYVMNPGFDPVLEDSLVVGFRVEIVPGER
ncbi:MAG: carbohydrate porin [bacterium]